jgi:uncharacterized protein (UPF0548 family)
VSGGLGPAALDTVRVVVAVGAVVVLPAGLRLLGDRVVPRSASVAWPVAGAVAAVAVWLPTGSVAALLAVPFAAACLVLAGCGVRVLRGVRGDLSRLGTAVALGTPAVGAAALVAERAGRGLLGFSGDHLVLTVPHMLFAGFGACLVAGLLARASGADRTGSADPASSEPGATRTDRPVAPLRASRTARTAAVATPVGVLVVLAAYFVSDAAELVGALLLTTGLWCAAATAWRLDAPGRARALLRVGAVATGAAMLLATWWALGEATGIAHPGLGWMVATHGLLNAGGFVLCTLLALRLSATGAETGRPAAVAAGGALTYAPVGGTRSGARPDGFRHLAVRHRLLRVADESDRDRVGEALRRWQVHAAAHVDLRGDADRAEPGVRVETRLGVGRWRLVEPCEVVWVTRDGFGYGSLPGHLFRGEEAFTVELDEDGLWFVVVAYSTPAVAWVRALGPLVVVGQRLYLRVLAHGARRVAARRTPAPAVAR